MDRIENPELHPCSCSHPILAEAETTNVGGRIESSRNDTGKLGFYMREKESSFPVSHAAQKSVQCHHRPECRTPTLNPQKGIISKFRHRQKLPKKRPQHFRKWKQVWTNGTPWNDTAPVQESASINRVKRQPIRRGKSLSLCIWEEFSVYR